MGTLVGCIFYFLHVHIIHFLTRKRLDPCFAIPEVNEVDIYQFEPFELPGRSEFQSDDQVWYFFSEPYYRNASSKRRRRVRAAGAGYWKSTGHGCDVKDKEGKKVGRKRTLVFYKRERGPPSRETKTNWVMHEFYLKDDSRYKKNFVFCYIEKQQNKKPSVSTPGDGQPSSSSASDSINHFIEDTYTEVQSQELLSNPLISDTANRAIENPSTEVASHQTSSPSLDSDSSYLGAEILFSMLKSQVLQGQIPASDLANHVLENIISTVELDHLLPSHSMNFDLGTHMAENTSLMVEPLAEAPCNLVSQFGNLVVQDNFPRVEPQLQSSFNMAFDSRNHVANTFSMVAPQLPLCLDMIFDSRNHVAENTCCMVMKSMPYVTSEYQPLVDILQSSQYVVSDLTNYAAKNAWSKVDFSSLADFGALDGCNGLNFSSFSAPINPGQGSYCSSYSNSFNQDCNVWSSQLDGEHEYVVHSPQNFQDEYPHEGTGQTLPDGTDAETIDMMKELCQDIPLIGCVNRN